MISSYVNQILSMSLFHHIGISQNQGKFFMCIIKLYVSIVSSFRYLFNKEPFIPMQNILVPFLLYDVFNIVVYTGVKTITYNAVLYHHISMVVAMLFEPETCAANFPLLTFCGEISNIFMYFHYMLLTLSKTYDIPSHIIKLSHKIEIYVYIIIRIFIATTLSILLTNKDNMGYHFYYMQIPIYCMGIFWGYNLYKQLKTIDDKKTN